MADIYKNGDTTVLDLLLAAGDFTEIDTQVNYFRDIHQADANAVSSIETLTRSVADLAAEVSNSVARRSPKRWNFARQAGRRRR